MDRELETRITEKILTLLSEEKKANRNFTLPFDISLALQKENSFFSKSLELFVSQKFREEEAYSYWVEIFNHYNSMVEALRRDTGLKVALFDYVANVHNKISNTANFFNTFWENSFPFVSCINFKSSISAITRERVLLYRVARFISLLQEISKYFLLNNPVILSVNAVSSVSTKVAVEEKSAEFDILLCTFAT